MGFRNPLRTASAVDPGTAGPRVVVTQTGGRMGGGAVNLYPNTTAAYGELAAGVDETGAVTVLYSPGRPSDGQASNLVLSDAEVGDEGVVLSSNAGIYLLPASGRVVRGLNLDTCLYDPTAGTWRGGYLASGVFGADFMYTSYRRPTAYRAPDGMVRLFGLLGLDAAPTPGKLLATWPAGLAPAKGESFVCIGGNNRPWRCDALTTGLYFQGSTATDWAFTAGTGTGASYLSLAGCLFPSADLF